MLSINSKKKQNRSNEKLTFANEKKKKKKVKTFYFKEMFFVFVTGMHN